MPCFDCSKKPPEPDKIRCRLCNEKFRFHFTTSNVEKEGKIGEDLEKYLEFEGHHEYLGFLRERVASLKAEKTKDPKNPEES